VKPAAFDYVRPATLDEAMDQLARYQDDARPLAGGQSLVPLLAMRLVRPAVLIDLQDPPELRRITRSSGSWRVGAMVTQRELERRDDLPDLVRAAVAQIGHLQIRNRGTVGGSLAHMDPAAELPALALATGAVLVAEGRAGRREISAGDFICGPLTTSLRPDELLVEVVLPSQPVPWGFAEVSRRPGDFALVGAVRHGEHVVVFAAGPTPQRLRSVEAALAAGERSATSLGQLAAGEIEARGDVHAGPGYRREVGAELVASVCTGDGSEVRRRA
jgi:aerobic carbon-monoxide dehydrogenase medium subunit